jgi:hypothetical protein
VLEQALEAVGRPVAWIDSHLCRVSAPQPAGLTCVQGSRKGGLYWPRSRM